MDSGVIASGGADGVVRLMALTGDHIGRYRHDDLVNTVAVSNTGRVASGSRDGTIRVWRPETQRSSVVGTHDHWVMAVAWSPSGHRMATGSEDGTIALWNPESAGVRRIEVGAPVNALDWVGDTIAAVSRTRLLILDPEGEVQAEFTGAAQLLWSVAVSPATGAIAWVGRDRILRITAHGGTRVIPAHRDQIWGVTWDGAGSRIVTASADGSVAIWTATGDIRERVAVPAWARRAVLHGDTIYVATEDGAVRTFADDGMPPEPPAAITVRASAGSCGHWDPVVTTTTARRCGECGSHQELRLCVTCGHVGCCESQLAHGTKHWVQSGHPNTIPVTDGPIPWRWCHADDRYVPA